MAESDADLYELPFEYVKTVVKPVREKALSGVGIPWWIHQRPRPEMRKALTGLNRYIASPRVSKYRLFVWVEPNTLADSRVVVIARKDDYFLGVLCSKIHELWSLNTCTWHGVGNDPTYVIEKCFEAFPFPWPPRNEPDYSELVEAIAMASRQLMEKRDAWLNPLGSSEEELASRTLTHLYNVYPTWLQEAHRKLDEAVFAGYGWPITLTDAEILGRLLILNHERAA
jgi:type II restriction/modification system DNA methylase subunit YeeA